MVRRRQEGTRRASRLRRADATSTWPWWSAGIIDPAKVTRSALENAASIAAMILTTEALITDIPEKEKAPAMPPGGMDY